MSAPLRADEANDPFAGAPSFSRRHRLLRACFGLVWSLLASWTPPPLHRWRVLLLRIFGARIAWSARVYGSAKVWYPPNLEMEAQAVMGPGVTCYCMGPIHIGARAVISQRAHLCGGTHDIADPYFQLLTRPVTIGADAWICAESFVGPGVSVGEGAVLAARAAAFRDLEPWSVWRGNPATRIKDRPSFTRTAAAGTRA